MAKAGDELVNPVTGLRTVFRKTARDTDGELLQVDWIGEPGWTTGPDSPSLQEERFGVSPASWAWRRRSMAGPLPPTRGEARLPGRSRNPPAVLRATRAR